MLGPREKDAGDQVQRGSLWVYTLDANRLRREHCSCRDQASLPACKSAGCRVGGPGFPPLLILRLCMEKGEALQCVCAGVRLGPNSQVRARRTALY